jgi:hypothetical protein
VVTKARNIWSQKGKKRNWTSENKLHPKDESYTVGKAKQNFIIKKKRLHFFPQTYGDAESFRKVVKIPPKLWRV